MRGVSIVPESRVVVIVNPVRSKLRKELIPDIAKVDWFDSVAVLAAPKTVIYVLK
jgi:hypothetical protein